MTASVLLVACCLGAAACASVPAPAPPPPAAGPVLQVDSILRLLADRYLRAATARAPEAGVPRAIDASCRWQVTPVHEWTSGFFPGTLWYQSSFAGAAALRAQAERWTRPLSAIPDGPYSHDLGFQFLGSFGNAYRFTGDTTWRAPAIHAASLLADRFNPTVGAIKSWDWMPPERPFPVIVDNLMNLELLLWGARQPGGDPRWRQLAITHARTTTANHLRPDGGSYHVVVFDPATGAVRERITHQGYADASTWARGQAWLIYGFTMLYRETGLPEFLRTAQRAADYVLRRLPPDGVPCWDYQAPGCPASAPRDASAAAITAAALLELSTFVDSVNRTRYRAAAELTLATLTSPAYFAPACEAGLAHAVGNLPAGTEVDVGLVYADYYLVEALLRWRELAGVSAAPPLLRAAAPPVHTLRGELLSEARARLRQGDTTLLPALARLRAAADSALRLGPFTVTAKERVPPSGDRHDYVSYAPYWWPDSSRADGLPYVRRDGQVNQVLRRDSDALRFYALTAAVETLALGYFFTGSEAYAQRAATLLRTWFLDPATRMNPHLRYAQAIPGVTTGRGIGIIDTRELGRLTDAIVLLTPSGTLAATDLARLGAWFRTYLDWLLGSEPGQSESRELNNHGTWYDAQVAALALFLDDSARVRLTLGRAAERIATQVDPDGRQPLELARTRSFHYSAENLEAFARLAELGRHVGIDLWHWRAPNGASLIAALDLLAPYVHGPQQWPYPQITPEPADLLVQPFFRAAAALGGRRYDDILRDLPPALTRDHPARLLYPR